MMAARNKRTGQTGSNLREIPEGLFEGPARLMFERELIRERMLVGIAKARAEGKYKGRAPTARAKADKVKQLRASGVGPSEIARQLGISRTSVFRILTA